MARMMMKKTMMTTTMPPSSTDGPPFVAQYLWEPYRPGTPNIRNRRPDVATLDLHPEHLAAPVETRTPQVLLLRDPALLAETAGGRAYADLVWGAMAAARWHLFVPVAHDGHVLVNLWGDRPWPPHIWPGVHAPLSVAHLSECLAPLNQIPSSGRVLWANPMHDDLCGHPALDTISWAGIFVGAQTYTDDATILARWQRWAQQTGKALSLHRLAPPRPPVTTRSFETMPLGSQGFLPGNTTNRVTIPTPPQASPPPDRELVYERQPAWEWCPACRQGMPADLLTLHCPTCGAVCV